MKVPINIKYLVGVSFTSQMKMLPSSSTSDATNHRKIEKRKCFTTAFKLEKVNEFKKQCLSSNKFAEFIGVPSSTFKGWKACHQKNLLTSDSVALSDPDRKRFRKAEYPEVEKKLVTYLESRFLYEQAKCRLSWLILQVMPCTYYTLHSTLS